MANERSRWILAQVFSEESFDSAAGVGKQRLINKIYWRGGALNIQQQHTNLAWVHALRWLPFAANSEAGYSAAPSRLAPNRGLPRRWGSAAALPGDPEKSG